MVLRSQLIKKKKRSMHYLKIIRDTIPNKRMVILSIFISWQSMLIFNRCCWWMGCRYKATSWPMRIAATTISDVWCDTQKALLVRYSLIVTTSNKVRNYKKRWKERKWNANLVRSLWIMSLSKSMTEWNCKIKCINLSEIKNNLTNKL